MKKRFLIVAVVVHVLLFFTDTGLGNGPISNRIISLPVRWIVLPEQGRLSFAKDLMNVERVSQTINHWNDRFATCKQGNVKLELAGIDFTYLCNDSIPCDRFSYGQLYSYFLERQMATEVLDEIDPASLSIVVSMSSGRQVPSKSFTYFDNKWIAANGWSALDFEVLEQIGRILGKSGLGANLPTEADCEIMFERATQLRESLFQQSKPPAEIMVPLQWVALGELKRYDWTDLRSATERINTLWAPCRIRFYSSLSTSTDLKEGNYFDSYFTPKGEPVRSSYVRLSNDSALKAPYLSAVIARPRRTQMDLVGGYLSSAWNRPDWFLVEANFLHSSAPAHEIGHALGLEHALDKENLMFERTSRTQIGLKRSQCVSARAGAIRLVKELRAK